MNISVVIPCLNEARTLGECLQAVRDGILASGMSGEIIVSDNGSNDASVKIAQSFGARVVHCSTRGYGAALNTGILAAQGSIILFGDADLSYDFRELQKFVTPIADGTADLVLGNRLNQELEPGAMPWINRKIGTPFLSFLIRRRCGIQTSDCNSGMRAIKREQYLRLKLKSSGMEIASEMLLRAAKISLKYFEVDIKFKKDGRNGPSHLRRWRDGLRHLRIILSHSTAFAATAGLLVVMMSCATGNPKTAEPLQPGFPKKVCFAIRGMTCGSCATKITIALESKAGVAQASVSLKSESAEVLVNSAATPPSQMKDAIDQIGYQATEKACE